MRKRNRLIGRSGRKCPAALILSGALLVAGSGCITNPGTTRAGTRDLLNIHEAIAPVQEVDFQTVKLVFFGDLHRGMGERDFFKDNRKLWLEILRYYNQEEFTLVLIGDIEEGWGFQPDNVPIILQWHKDAFELEAEFARADRYVRIYGNHDDYYRCRPVGYGMTIVAPVYPAVIFKDRATSKRMFVTHGCQGQGLHDAGDRVAAFGVFARFNWLLEIMPKKTSEGRFAAEAKKIQADFDRHEQHFYDWAVERNYDFLVGGHTHRPVYNLNGVHYSYELLKRDIENERFPLFSYYSDDGQAVARGAGSGSARVQKTEIDESTKKKMLDQLDREARDVETGPVIQPRFRERGAAPTQYYNPGCGYLSEIPCLEMTGGRIIHKYFALGPNGELEWKILDPDTKAMVRRKPGQQ